TDDNVARNDNWVDTNVGHRSVSTLAKDSNLQPITSGHDWTGRQSHCSSFLDTENMLPEHDIWLREIESGVESVFHHQASSRDFLFGWLEEAYQSTSPLRSSSMQEFRGAHQAADMYIVATSMHDWDFMTLRVYHRLLAGVWESCVLTDGECIHISAKEDSGPMAVLEHPNESMATDVLVHAVA
ncbi:MAG: hypothetical protein Q9169_008724, partial [Polycauliona sp. 2 TL-2023]